MRLLTCDKVLEATGFKKSTLYKWMLEGKFPRPITLRDSRSVRWVDKDVDDWILSQVSKNQENIFTK